MTPRRQRLLAVLVILAGAGVAAALVARALNENSRFFFSPSEVAAGDAPAGRAFRVGGLVTLGSVQRKSGELDVRFVLTDLKQEISVSYSGILPDLFREGQGIIAHGTLGPDGVFQADEVLAKHDESYTAPEIEAALKAAPIPEGAP